MTSKAQRPPVGEPWIWLTRELLSSDAWRSLTVSSRRFIDFLLLEHMRQGGRGNGRLKAPHRQLVAFGVGARFVTSHIREAEEFGLVDCYRGGMRVATTYALTWLPLHDGTPATNHWRSYSNPALPPMPQPKSRNLPAKGEAGLPAKGEADGPNLPAKGEADGSENLPAKGEALSRKASYQGGREDSELSGPGGPPRSVVVELPRLRRQ